MWRERLAVIVGGYVLVFVVGFDHIAEKPAANEFKVNELLLFLLNKK